MNVEMNSEKEDDTEQEIFDGGLPYGNELEIRAAHYSDKGGHFQRGMYWKLQNKLGEGTHMRFAPPIDSIRAQDIRRAMRRSPRDGRK